MKKIFYFLGILVFLFVIYSFFYLPKDTYRISSNDFDFTINRKTISQSEGGRNGEGIIIVSANRKSSRNARIDVICSDNNYLAFADICNKSFPITSNVTKIDYIITDDSVISRNLKFNILIGDFSNPANAIADYILEQEIIIPGKDRFQSI
ncbi:MAG: hypothetical protein JWP09_183 [Candidatus Taylorbacteria bacterium]|nr:hypothetical protein [Candidatus Taylorbacteria bacterium]